MAKRKNPHAVALGRRGGHAAATKAVRARWRASTKEERRAAGQKAARARWSKAKRKK